MVNIDLHFLWVWFHDDQFLILWDVLLGHLRKCTFLLGTKYYFYKFVSDVKCLHLMENIFTLTYKWSLKQVYKADFLHMSVHSIHGERDISFSVHAAQVFTPLRNNGGHSVGACQKLLFHSCHMTTGRGLHSGEEGTASGGGFRLILKKVTLSEYQVGTQPNGILSCCYRLCAKCASNVNNARASHVERSLPLLITPWDWVFHDGTLSDHF